MPLPSGTRIGSYEVVGLVGVGGMGEVYRARDTRVRRDVAVKVLPELFARDAERLARFRREAQVLASLNHPNIAALYGVEESATGQALVMELVEGPTLAEVITRANSKRARSGGGLPLEDVLSMARQMAAALEAAHDHGLIHRDLKPGNVKIAADGTVKVLDFGLAKVVAPDDEVGAEGGELHNSPTITSAGTRLGVILGTAAYMSPEQARGKPLDKRSDIWAFGCVLYEMLTGRAAFDGDEISDVLARIIEREPNFSALPPATPPSIRRLLRRCLEKDRKRRLSDFGDARLEIDEASTSNATEAAPPAAPRQASRRAWTLGGALGLVVGAAGVWSLGWLTARSDAPRPFRLAIVPPTTTMLYSEPVGAPLALSPDGQEVVYTGVSGSLQLYARRVDELVARPLPGTDGARQPFFSHDGRSVGFFSPTTGELKRVALSGGPVSPICRAPLGNFFGASWGADDTIVFASGGLYRVSANGGTPQTLTTPIAGVEFEHRWPDFLPDGRNLLFTIWRGNPDRSKIAVQALAGGTPTVLLDGGTSPRYAASGRLVYYSNGALMAAPFDPGRLEVGATRALVHESIDASVAGAAVYAVARNGTLVYVSGIAKAERKLVWLDQQGRTAPLLDAGDDYWLPRLSPDGKRLAVGIGADIYVVDLARLSRSRVTHGTTSALFPFTWSRDGTRILYSKLEDKVGLDIYSVSADGSGQPELFAAGEFRQWATSASPVSDVIAIYEQHPSTLRDIWLLQPDRTRTRFLVTPYQERTPRFSPDGKWILYVSNDSGRDEIYVRPAADASTRITVSNDGGAEPVWAHDGREVYYRNGDRLLAAPVQSFTPFAVGTPRVLITTPSYERDRGAGAGNPNYDVARDLQRFVMIQAPTSSSNIVVVLNWFTELEERLKAGR